MKINTLNIILNKCAKYLVALILIFCCNLSSAQNPNGFNEFKYPSGKISSEGYMVNGKPEGYWKTYYENGNLKSEGNRRNSQLDSLWKFYSEDGYLVSSIEYKSGIKNGSQKFYSKDSSLSKIQIFRNDTITSNVTFHFNGKKKLYIPYQNREKHGNAFEYDITGLEITWIQYDFGRAKKFIINRTDAQGKKTGKWMRFENSLLRWEANYNRGLKNGVERIYDEKGNLLSINKYSNGQLLKDVKELQKIEVKKELGSNGLIAKSGGFDKNGNPHGIHREYDEKGNVKSSKVFENGDLVGEGIVKKNGAKDGDWVLYYKSGNKLAEGKFQNGNRIGYWKYYFENGLIESEGEYDMYGKQDGLWKEYYESGSIREEMNFIGSLLDGEYKSFDDSGAVVVSGNYKEDYENGEWFYIVGDHSEKGKFIDGQKTGEWRSYYNEKQITFKGSFQNGLPVGEHLYWYPSGGLRKFGKFLSGRKVDTWMYYSEGGKLIKISEFEDGLERSINGYSIQPEHDPDDYIEYEQTGYE